MKSKLLIVFSMCLAMACFAQEGKLSTKADQPQKLVNTKPKKGKGLYKIMKEMDPASPAYAMMEDARSQHNLGSIFGFAGCGLIAYSVTSLILGEQSSTILPILGCGFTLASIPILRRASRTAKKAIDLHNADTSLLVKPSDIFLNLKTTSLGVGLVFIF